MSDLDGAAVLVMCRPAGDQPVIQDGIYGYACRVCGVPLVISPTGVVMVERGGIPLCPRCGSDLARRAEEKGDLAGVMLGPDAVRQMVDEVIKERMRGAGGAKG